MLHRTDQLTHSQHFDFIQPLQHHFHHLVVKLTLLQFEVANTRDNFNGVVPLRSPNLLVKDLHMRLHSEAWLALHIGPIQDLVNQTTGRNKDNMTVPSLT